MDLENIFTEFCSKSIDELRIIQKECFITIRAAMQELSNHLDQDVNKIFFMFCLISCVLDGDVDEKEYSLAKEFLASNVTYNAYREYALSITQKDSIISLLLNFISIVGQFSKESIEEFVKFSVCFMACKGNISDVEKNFIEKLYKEGCKEKTC